MVSTLGVALLVALALGRLRSRERAGQTALGFRRASTITAVWVAYLAAFFGAYALGDGLPTRELPTAFATAYGKLAADHEDVRVLTTPFWQSWMPALAGSSSATTLEADLGAVSRYWHGHPTVFRGGWDPRASRFVTYLYGLVEQGSTRSLTKLTGAAGVKYLGIDPQPAMEVVGGQNAFFQRQHGLTRVAGAGPVTIYRNDYALPQAYTTPMTCIAVGGMHLLGDLADQPWFSFGRTGIVFADQVVATQGRAALVERLNARGTCLVIAPGGEDELAVLLDSVDRAGLSRFAPASFSQSPTDPGTDVEAEPSSNVDVLPGQRLVATLRAPRAGRYAVWLAALYGPDRGRLDVEIDGRRLGLRDFATAGSGTAWTHFSAVSLTSGKHRVAITNISPMGGPAAEVSRAALMPADAPRWRASASAARVIREYGGVGPLPTRSHPGKRLVAARWLPELGNGNAVLASAVGRGLTLHVRAPARRYYTLAQLQMARGLNPYRPFALRFKGTGSGRTFYLVVIFRGPGQPRALFAFRDSGTAERVLLFSPLQPSSVDSVPDWSYVASLSLATDSKAVLRGSILIDGPFESNIDATPRFRRPKDEDPFGKTQGMSPALAPHDQAVSDEARLAPRTGPGLLVLSQSYHPGWRLHATHARARHTIALGFANAYELPRAVADASVKFDAAKWGRLGTLVSLAAWFVAALFLLLTLARARLSGHRAWRGFLRVRGHGR
jgi:hypothetical protein